MHSLLGKDAAALRCHKRLRDLTPMPEEQLKAFPKKLNPTRIARKLRAAASTEATRDNRNAGFLINSEYIQSIQSESGEASDNELERAAGGQTSSLSLIPAGLR